MRKLPSRLSTAQGGAAALVIVMVLFFIISLVAAYASRNLIFEQRTSANNYRSTQAFDAAEAGVEWAIAMLNGGRVDDACLPPPAPVDTTKTTFRDRYLVANAGGMIGVRQWLDAGVPKDFNPGCVRAGNAWSCSCPESGAPVLGAPAGTGPAPTFSVKFSSLPPPGQPGVVRIEVQGCSSYGKPCFAGATGNADAQATVVAYLGLAPALTQTPAAALTARGPASFDTGNARFVNTGSPGLALNTGGPITGPMLITGPAGTPVDQLFVDGDPSLNLTPSGTLSKGEMMFLAAFGMPPAAFRLQPAVVRLSCVGDCAAQLQLAADLNPGRVLWIDGTLTVGAASTLSLGSNALPAVVVVNGDMDLAAGSTVNIQGLVYSRGATWTAAGDASVTGAFIAEGAASVDPAIDGGFSIVGAPVIRVDATAVDQLNNVRTRQVLDFGSFVRVPGSWRDFPL